MTDKQKELMDELLQQYGIISLTVFAVCEAYSKANEKRSVYTKLAPKLCEKVASVNLETAVKMYYKYVNKDPVPHPNYWVVMCVSNNTEVTHEEVEIILPGI